MARARENMPAFKMAAGDFDTTATMSNACALRIGQSIKTARIFIRAAGCNQYRSGIFYRITIGHVGAVAALAVIRLLGQRETVIDQ